MLIIIELFLSCGYFWTAVALAFTYLLMPIRIHTRVFEICIGKQPPASPKIPLLTGGKHS
jgi:hypothetical protein